jgi:hypothetical protein
LYPRLQVWQQEKLCFIVDVLLIENSRNFKFLFLCNFHQTVEVYFWCSMEINDLKKWLLQFHYLPFCLFVCYDGHV